MIQDQEGQGLLVRIEGRAARLASKLSLLLNPARVICSKVARAGFISTCPYRTTIHALDSVPHQSDAYRTTQPSEC